MIVWATEDDTERVEVFMEFRKQPVAGSETANQENKLQKFYHHMTISIVDKYNAHSDRSGSDASLLFKSLCDGIYRWLKQVCNVLAVREKKKHKFGVDSENMDKPSQFQTP